MLGIDVKLSGEALREPEHELQAARKHTHHGYLRVFGPMTRVIGRGRVAAKLLEPMTTITRTRWAAAGGPSFPPPAVTNAASVSGQSIPSGSALQRATMAPFQAAPNAPKNGT
jgi:hypothetical protein